MKPEIIAKAITDKLGEITKSVIEKSESSEKDDNKKVVINIDEDKLAKSIVTEINEVEKSNSHSDEDETDDEDYQDIYDEMSEKELRKNCSEREIPVFSKTTVNMMKSKLRSQDKIDEKNKTEKEKSEMSLEDKRKAMKEKSLAIAAELGLSEDEVEFNFVSKKKSKDKDDDNNKNDDDNEEYDSEEDLMKAIEGIDNEDDQQEALGHYFSGMAKKELKK